MNCESIKRKIPAYLDGEISEINASRLREHFDSCTKCKTEMEAYKNVNNALDLLPAVMPTFSLNDVKRRALERRSESSRTWGFLHIGRMPRWAAALAATFAILIGAVGGVSLESLHQPISQYSASPSDASNMLSLGGSDDPMVDLILTGTRTNSMVSPSGQEGNR